MKNIKDGIYIACILVEEFFLLVQRKAKAIARSYEHR